MRKFKFVGFGEKTTYFGEGKFTVGKIYETHSVSFYPSVNPDARFIDDNGIPMWEELHGFEEVTNHDTE